MLSLNPFTYHYVIFTITLTASATSVSHDCDPKNEAAILAKFCLNYTWAYTCELERRAQNGSFDPNVTGSIFVPHNASSNADHCDVNCSSEKVWKRFQRRLRKHEGRPTRIGCSMGYVALGFMCLYEPKFTRTRPNV
ncbi:unnamed protein product [Cylicocyclus nassatus]|uniref:Secreted protein n=1 Tax=Cylicocyclus nassatus TaxID=53992 RepID=A0AA36DME8_CYLNA|nr:unnamed protein product [Cylicocyclus nassatus]